MAEKYHNNCVFSILLGEASLVNVHLEATLPHSLKKHMKSNSAALLPSAAYRKAMLELFLVELCIYCT